ncbi:MAG: PKD domain-containing protein, partial [Anaerolineae bacterium]
DGVFTTTLQVSSNDPDEPQIDVGEMLTVAPCIPVAGADFVYDPPDPQGGQLVEFRGSVSEGSGDLAFGWSFGDGESATGQLVHHRFPLSVMTQTYTVVLTVSGCVNQEMVSHDVTVRPSGDVIYVDGDATGVPDGNSWETAYPDLQSALTEAASGDEIWVAEGIYTPTVEHGCAGDRCKSFQMVNGVAIYGGFDPSLGDIAFEDRDWVGNVTVLSGDLNGDDGPGFQNNGENSYTIFYHGDVGLNDNAILDGFTISGGNANGSPTAGGGMFNYSSSPTLINCTFSGNTALGGGGMFNGHGASPVLINCTFLGNSADYKGGGILNDGAWAELTNCTFVGNSASLGGGIYTYYQDHGGPLELANCTFSANVGGAMANSISSPVLTNCILWGDIPQEIYNDEDSLPVVTYSDIQGGYEGEGNIDADPRFVDPDNGDLHLKPDSPCIDAGTNNASDLPEYDFEGDNRIVDGNGDGVATVDMGVDEAAFLYPSRKTASTSAALPGDPVTYTIALHNEAPIDSTEIRVTDTLPLSLTYMEDSLTATAGSFGSENRVITWTGSLSAGGSVRITFGTTISTIVPLGTEVINSAVISAAGEIVTRTARVFVGHQIYLPLVMRSGS